MSYLFWLLLWILEKDGAGWGWSDAPWHARSLFPTDVDFCLQASRCCHLGVDEHGWIMAAVGWSLWFLTLILLCVDKLMKLTPDEPKDLQA